MRLVCKKRFFRESTVSEVVLRVVVITLEWRGIESCDVNSKSFIMALRRQINACPVKTVFNAARPSRAIVASDLQSGSQ